LQECWDTRSSWSRRLSNRARHPEKRGNTSLAPKSNAVKTAYFAGAEAAAATARDPVPLHLRNSVTPLMKSVGYGQGYRYVHDDRAAREEMPCLPTSLNGRVYFAEDVEHVARGS